MTFEDLGVREETVALLKNIGITVPTPIQERCIGLIGAGKDVIAQAQTGTGKTLAFLLPIIDNIDSTSTKVQALIVTPTRELALQITKEAEKLVGDRAIGILAVYGGKDVGAQHRRLNGQTHVIIATPGRLLDHVRRETVDLRGLKTVVLDEADEMLFMGFKNEVDDIIRVTPQKRQTLCFSATMDSAVKKLAYRYMISPVMVSVAQQRVTLDNIRQEVVRISDREKKDSLCQVIDQDRPYMAIIFCRTKRRADELEAVMKQRKYDCEKIHSDIAQNKRERIMKTFRQGDLQLLIATDVAARGLDITGVTHIYNYDTPETTEGYIHRIGRTGRAGEEGYTCLFIAPKDEDQLREIEMAIEMAIPERKL